MYQTLIDTEELSKHLEDPNWAIVDCRFTLGEPEHGRNDYLKAHIPGAVYAHLEEHLSGKVIPGQTGRHPLPTAQAAAVAFANYGIGPGVQVVAYDDAGGALAAVRVWWMLRWLGHLDAAVLDGGWQKWLSEGRPTRSGNEAREWREFIPEVHPERWVDAVELDAMRQNSAYRVFDARLSERFRGQNETIDPVAGHIPGAISAPYIDNLTTEGTFRPAEELRRHYEKLLDGVPAENAVFYCGSGVTSIHNILAILHAGLGEARLYPGSWSEWIASRDRPVATGE